ncbi:endonuclease III [Fusibacter sp. JL298sf-3]
MTKKAAIEVLDILDDLYPDAKAELDYNNPFELLVAVVLSAQCTDVRVNQVTGELFKVASTPEDLYKLPIAELEAIIKPCGLFKTKAKNLHQTAKILYERYASTVPSTHEALLELPGVGQKTANVVVSNAFGIPAIAVDTHVFRVSNRLGLAKASTVEATEKQLEKALPKARWTKAHHQLIFLGRRICKARKPQCDACPLTAHCRYFKQQQKESKKCKK